MLFQVVWCGEETIILGHHIAILCWKCR